MGEVHEEEDDESELPGSKQSRQQQSRRAVADELLTIVIAKPSSGGMGFKVNGRNTVTGISKGGVADRAGLRVDDVVFRVDGEVLTPGTGLAAALHGRNEGRKHSLSVSRAQARAEYLTVDVPRGEGGAGNLDVPVGAGDDLDKYLAGPPPVSMPDLMVMEPASVGAPAVGAPDAAFVMMV